MTVGTFLASGAKRLRTAGISSARLDCLVLLEDTLSIDRAYILAHLEAEIPQSTEVTLNKKIAQRATHIPLAYIRGQTEFYGREFLVNQHVLVPRPESEAIINLLKSLHLPVTVSIADIGTGSGCLGITAALEFPRAIVHLYDIDKKALMVAEQNAHLYKLRNVRFIEQNLLAHPAGDYDVILANLPYVPDDYTVNKAARHEPHLALYSGSDGLELYRRFWAQIACLNTKPKHVLTESLPFQHKALTALASDANYRAVKTEGLIQLFELFSRCGA